MSQQTNSRQRGNTGSQPRARNLSALIEELADWCQCFAIVSIEDPLGDDDWSGWQTATTTFGGIQLIGDDLFATNPERLRRGINRGIADAVLNQAACLTLASEVANRARDTGYPRIVSARSGDTEDTWVADLALASSAVAPVSSAISAPGLDLAISAPAGI